MEKLHFEEVKVSLTFKEGDSVQVVSGMFTGFSGVVQTISEDLKRATVLVKKSNRDIAVEIECQDLKKAD